MSKNSAFVIKLISVVTIILILTGLNEKFQIIQCNMRRNYKTMEDRTIQNIKDKISDLEKEPIKDVATTNRLAEQYALLGRIFLEKKIWNQSIDCYLNSEKYGGNGASVMYALALAYANRGYESSSEDDFARAEVYYRKSLDKEPGYDDAMYGLGILMYYHRNNKEEGVKLISELAMKNPTYYPARFAMARFHYENNELQKSLQEYQQLQHDLDSLPASAAVNEYRKNCTDNISRIITELSSK